MNDLLALDEQLASALGEGSGTTGKGKRGRSSKQHLGINSMGNPSVPSLSPKSGSKHGALKAAILKVLKKAGKRGRTIRELADDVGVLSANIHVWFSTTGKRIDGLEKIGEARWRYTV